MDFPDHFYIYKQPEGVNPWYIGYGMDGPKGYSRNLDTIYTLWQKKIIKNMNG